MPQLLEVADHRFLHRRRGGIMIRRGAAGRLRDYLIDDSQLEEIGRGDRSARAAASASRALAVLPENRGAALDGDEE